MTQSEETPQKTDKELIEDFKENDPWYRFCPSCQKEIGPNEASLTVNWHRGLRVSRGGYSKEPSVLYDHNSVEVHLLCLLLTPRELKFNVSKHIKKVNSEQ